MPDGTANPNEFKPQVADAAKRARRRSVGVMALEPRVMYDAAAGAVVGTAVIDPTHATDSTTATSTTVSAVVPPATDVSHPTDMNATTSTAVSGLAPLAVTGAAPADSSSGHQIVFIDPHVPDYQILAAGVKPGEEVVVLDANTDGVKQIADWLASHDEHNVDAIHIVSHGEDGTIRLGSTILAANDINQFSQPLAAIGAALKPGGDILLYGCDVGQGAAGDIFMVEMSMATGGAHIAAASHLVGAADQGGSWNLNVQLGSIDVGNPFTAATLAAFNDILTDQIWFTTDSRFFNDPGNRVERIGVDGSVQTDVVDGALPNTSGLETVTGIVVDAARGKYFVANQDASGNNVILEGSTATGALDPTPIYVGPALTFDATTFRANNAYISGLQLDAASGELYFAQGVRDTSTGKNLATQTGIFKISETGTGLTQVVSFPSTALDAPRNFALDLQDNLVFFTDQAGQGSKVDNLGVANLTTGAVSFLSATQLAAAGVSTNNGLLSGIAVDPAHGMLYFTTVDTSHQNHNFIFSSAFTVTGSGATATATLGAINTLYTVGSSGAPANIVLDVPDGLFYVANATDNPNSSSAVSGSIQVGYLDGSHPLTTVFEASTISGVTNATKPANLFFESTPTVTAGGDAVFTQNGAAVAVDAGAAAADSSGQNLASASVAITGGTFLAGDTLTANTAGTAITASYDSTTGVLTLSGADTAAHYQQVLETVAFSSTSADPTSSGADRQRSLTWTVSDGVLRSNAAMSTVTVHMAPSVLAGATATFTGGGPAVTLDGALTVSDPDGTGNLTAATVSISGGFIAGDSLNFTDQNGISGSYDAATGVLTLAGTASLASYQAALDSVTYSFSPGNGDPTGGGANTSRTISWVANDGAANSNSVTSALNTVHVAPSVGAGATATFTGGGAPVTLDGTLTVSDPDSGGNLTSATVSISGGFTTGDTLTFSNQNGITGSYDAMSGVLTLSGTATVASYQAALDSITYSFSPGNGDPTGGGSNTSRTVSWVANDGVANSTLATSTLNTVHVAPSVVPDANATFIGGGAPVTLDGTLTVSDPDSGGNLSSATVSINSGFVLGDTLNFANQNGIVGSYDAASGVLTLSGTASVASYQAALDSVTYSFSPGNGDPTGGGSHTSRTISWVANDGVANSSPATSTLDTVHVAPSVVPDANATFIGGGAPVTLDGALTLSDPDSSGVLAGATVSISGGFIAGDTLNFGNQNGITGSYDAATGVLTLSGSASVASYQAALNSVTYSFSPGNGDPTGGGGNTSRTISWVANDGVANSSPATTTVDTVHVAPSIAGGATATFIGGGPAVTLDGALTVGDVDSNGNLAGATVSISGGFIAGDTLNFTNQSGITGSYNAATGVLTLTGTASLANYQAALDSITYKFSPANGDPTGGGSHTSRTISWVANDGVASSSAATSTLDTVHVGPSVAAGASATFTGGGPAATLDGALTVSDVDSNGNLAGATVSISGGFIAGDTLNFGNQNGITGSYNAATGVLTLTGTASLANYQAALDSITYGFSPANGDPTGGGSHTSRTISWVANDGVANSSSATSTLTTVHVPPSVAASGTATFTGGGSPVPLDSGVTVSDPDSGGTLTGATVSISGGFINGDLLNFANQNGISGSYNAATGTLTLTGTASLVNYQAALASITYGFTPSNGDPTQGGNTLRTISWAVNDGVATSSSAISTVSTVNATHVAPSVAGAGNTVTYTKQGPAVVVDGALTLNDPDSGGTLTGATVTIGSGFFGGDTLAAVTTGTGIKASYDASTGVLTLTGKDTIAHYQSVLESVTYSSTDNNPSQGNKDTTRTISWVVNDGAASNNLSAPVTSTIDLTPGQSTIHAPHGWHASPLQASTATAPIMRGDAELVTYLGPAPSPYADEHDTSTTVPAWMGAQQTGERDDRAAVDLRHAVLATDAELLAARRGHPAVDHGHDPDGDKPAAGKPGLLTQLKAAGRHGFIHERQALLKDLHKRSAPR